MHPWEVPILSGLRNENIVRQDLDDGKCGDNPSIINTLQVDTSTRNQNINHHHFLPDQRVVRSVLIVYHLCCVVKVDQGWNFNILYVGSCLNTPLDSEKYKGRLFFKQYMPKKPIKYKIKVWMAADSKTGYISDCDIYPYQCQRWSWVSHQSSAESHRALSALHIYFHNFFTSANLVEELLRQESYSCGTLRANRYPESYKDKRGRRKQAIKSRQERLTSCEKVQCLLPCGSTRDKLLFSPPTAIQMSI